MSSHRSIMVFFLTLFFALHISTFAQSTPPEKGVWDVKWNSSGTMYATANADGLVYLYDLNGNLIKTLSGHMDGIFTIDWSPEDSIIATAGSDPYLRFWDVNTGVLIEEIFTFAGGIFVIDWQSDGPYLVAIGFDGFKILNTDNMMFLEKMIFGTYFDIRWKPNTDFFAFANQGFLGTGEVNNGNIVGYTFQSEVKRYFTTNWNSDGTKTVFSEEISGNITIWDVETQTLEKTFHMSSDVSDAIFIGDFIVAATKNGTLQVVNIITEEIEIVATGLGRINAIDRNPNNNQIVYVGVTDSGEALIADVDVTGFAGLPSITFTPAPTDTPTPSPIVTPIILDVAWSPDGEMIATVDNSGKLEITFADQTATVFEFTRTVPDLVKASVSWSPLGDRLAAGIGNHMYVWDTTSWQLLYDYEVGAPSGLFFDSDLGDNNPEGVQNITWSLDGRYMVVGTYSYEISVWDMQEEELIFRDLGISGGGPGGVWLDSGWLGDGFGKLNIFSGEEIFPTVDDIQNRFGGNAVGGSTEPRPDNTQMAWGDRLGSLVIYDPNTLRGINAIQVTDSIPPAPRRSIADISWDGTWNFIAVVSHDGELYVANLLTKEVATVLNVDGLLNAVDWNPVGNEIVYAGVSSTGEPILEIVDVTGIAGIAPIPVIPLTESTDMDPDTLKAQPSAYVSWSPDGQYIATAAADKVTVFRVADQEVMNEFLTNRITLTAPIWSSDSQNLAFSSGVDFEIWSNVDSTPVLEHLYTDAGGSKAAAWSENGDLLALSNGEFVDFWDVSSDTLAQRYLNEGIGSAWSLDWNDDHNSILIAGALGVKVLHIETETSLLYFSIEPYVNAQGEYVNPTALSVVWSPSQDHIAIASDDAVRVVSASPSQDSETILFPYDSNVFTGHIGYVYSVAWHPSGDFLASSGEDGTVRIWNVETREQIQLINAGEAAVRSVAWSPDGSQLAYGGIDDTIIILTPNLPTITPTATTNTP